MNWQDLLAQAEEGGSYDAIPEGQYHAVVADATAKPSSSGKQMIVATFEVTAGPYKGRRVWNNFVISRDNPNALGWFFRHMSALGVSKDFFALNPPLEAVAAQIKGKPCVIDVSTRVWNNETRNDVKKITAAQGAMPTAAPAPTPSPMPTDPSPSAGTPPSVPF